MVNFPAPERINTLFMNNFMSEVVFPRPTYEPTIKTPEEFEKQLSRVLNNLLTNLPILSDIPYQQSREIIEELSRKIMQEMQKTETWKIIDSFLEKVRDIRKAKEPENRKLGKLINYWLKFFVPKYVDSLCNITEEAIKENRALIFNSSLPIPLINAISGSYIFEISYLKLTKIAFTKLFLKEILGRLNDRQWIKKQFSKHLRFLQPLGETYNKLLTLRSQIFLYLILSAYKKLNNLEEAVKKFWIVAPEEDRNYEDFIRDLRILTVKANTFLQLGIIRLPQPLRKEHARESTLSIIKKELQPGEKGLYSELLYNVYLV